MITNQTTKKASNAAKPFSTLSSSGHWLNSETTLALNHRGNVTRSPEQWYQYLHKSTYVLHFFLIKKELGKKDMYLPVSARASTDM